MQPSFMQQRQNNPAFRARSPDCKPKPVGNVFPRVLCERVIHLNEENDRKRIDPFLRVGALLLALVLLWQVVVPSMTNAIRREPQTQTSPTVNPVLLEADGSVPDSAQGYSDLADQSITDERYADALLQLEAAINLLSAEDVSLSQEDGQLLEELWLKFATVAILTGDYTQGRQALDEVLELAPEDSQALLLRAQLSVEDGAYQEAVSDVLTYLEGNPKDGDTRRTLAQLQEQMGDYAGALEQYESLYSLFPEDESANLNAYRCLFLLGRYQEAADGFDSYILRLPEGEPDPYGGIAEFLRAASLLQLGQNQEAAEGFERALQVGYDKASCLEQLTLCRMETGEYQKLIEAGQELTALEEGTISAPALLYQRMGIAAIYLEDYQGALEYLKEAESTGETPEGNPYYRGICLLSLQQYQEAVEAFTQSIAQGYMLQLSYYNRGVCYISLEQYETAREDMKLTRESGDDPDLIATAQDIEKQITDYLDQSRETTGETAE